MSNGKFSVALLDEKGVEHLPDNSGVVTFSPKSKYSIIVENKTPVRAKAEIYIGDSSGNHYNLKKSEIISEVSKITMKDFISPDKRNQYYLKIQFIPESSYSAKAQEKIQKEAPFMETFTKTLTSGAIFLGNMLTSPKEESFDIENAMTKVLVIKSI